MKYAYGDKAGQKMTHAEKIHNLGILYDLICGLQLGDMPSQKEIDKASEALTNLYTKGDAKEIYKQQAEYYAMIGEDEYV